MVGLRKGLEQNIEFLLRNADAAVGDCQNEMARFMGEADQNLAALGEFEGVVDEVGEYLVQPHGVGQHRLRHVRRHAGGKVQTLRRGIFPEQAGHVAGDTGRIDRNAFQLQLAGLDLGEVENVVDDGQQAVTRFDDHFGISLQALVEAGAGQKLGHDHEAVQRGTDFVAHGGEEARFRVVGAFGGVAGQAQFPGALLDRRFEALAVAVEGFATGADLADHRIEAVDQQAGLAIRRSQRRAPVVVGGANVLDRRGQRQNGAGDARLQPPGDGEADADGEKGHGQTVQYDSDEPPRHIRHIGNQHHLTDAPARLDDIDGDGIGAATDRLDNADAGSQRLTVDGDGAAK